MIRFALCAFAATACLTAAADPVPAMAAAAEHVARNAALLVRMLEKRGIDARILETPGAPVSVYGELAAPGATRTLVFYERFDRQPVGPESAWLSPPFEPTLRAGRAEDDAAVVAWGAHVIRCLTRRACTPRCSRKPASIKGDAHLFPHEGSSPFSLVIPNDFGPGLG
jgi:hypothetical protein